MIASFAVRMLCAAAVASLAFTILAAAPAAQAQQKPTPAAVSLAREIVELKGALTMFDPVVVGVIEHHRNLLTQSNPTAASDLETVASQLRKELEPRATEIHARIAEAYAEQFTLAELKELLAFYKSPLGRKVIEGEPKALEIASDRVEEWAEKLAGEVTARMRTELKKKGHNLL